MEGRKPDDYLEKNPDWSKEKDQQQTLVVVGILVDVSAFQYPYTCPLCITCALGSLFFLFLKICPAIYKSHSEEGVQRRKKRANTDS